MADEVIQDEPVIDEPVVEWKEPTLHFRRIELEIHFLRWCLLPANLGVTNDMNYSSGEELRIAQYRFLIFTLSIHSVLK